MRIKLPNYSLMGMSISGRYTSICIPEFKICFDMGCLPDVSIGAHTVFITHGHMDHIGDLNLHLRQRRLRGIQRSPNYVMPQVCMEPFKVLYSACDALDRGHRDTTLFTKMLDFNLFSSEGFQNKEFKVNHKAYVKAYPMVHRVPAFGYVLFERRTKLKEEYKNLKGSEIAALRKQENSPDMFDITEKNLIAFTGDTTIEGIIYVPDFLEAETLIIECTHLQDVAEEETHHHKHTHIKDILKYRELIKCQNLVLCHFSGRYFDKPGRIRELLDELDFFEQMKPINVYLFDEMPI